VGARDLPRCFNYILPFGPSNNGYNSDPNQGNPNKSVYGVSLFDTITSTEIFVNLIHVPEGIFSQNPQALTSSAPFQNLTGNVQYYSINSIFGFLNQINTAYQTATTQMIAAVPALAGLTAPVISLNPQTGFLSVVAPKAFFGAGGRVNAGINSKLRSIIKNFNFYSFFGRLFNFQFVDDAGTTTTAQQEVVNLDAFTLIKSIVLTSNAFNITPYFVDNPPLPGQTQGEQANNLSQSAVSSIIASFDLVDNPQGSNLRTIVAYQPTAEYRRSSFLSDDPLRRIQFTLYYNDNLGNYIPYYINPNENISFLIMFERLDED
jgi:hypothetical protein